MNSEIKGNSCIYFLFQVSNFFIFFLGAATTGIGIYICITGGSFLWYNGGFVGLGLVTFLSGFLGWKAKHSTIRLTLYCIIILGCFLVQSGFTIGVIAYGKFNDVVDGEQNANPVRYTLIGCCFLLLLCFVTAFFYRRSLNNRISVHLSGSYKPLKNDKPSESEPAYKSKYDQVRERTKNMT